METQPQGSLLKQLANSLQIASVFSGLYKVAEVIHAASESYPGSFITSRRIYDLIHTSLPLVV